jgi:hypothetical protein
MRGLTSTLILVVVLAGLGWYIYFVDSKRPEGSSTPDGTTRAKVFSVETDKIEELKVTAGGETSLLRKSADGWKLIQPAEAEADAAEAINVAQGLSNIETSRTVDDNPVDLKEYGLAAPAIAVEFKAGNTSGSLLLGEKTPTMSDMYAMKGGEKRVFLVPAFQESTFNKKTFDLRDKKILKFDRDKADSLSLVRGADAIDIAKTGSDWKVVKPNPGRSDFSAVEGLISRLSSANMSKLVDSEGTDLAKYGLDKPSMTLSIGAGSARTVLQVGKTENSDTYAKDASRPLVFTVDTTLQDDLKKNFDDYRKKELFEFRQFSLAKLRTVLDAPAGPRIFEFEKKPVAKPGDPDVWKVTREGGPTHEISSSVMDDLTGKLIAIKVESYPDAKTKTGIEKPALVVSVSYEGNFERVRFGQVGDNAFGAREGEATGKLDKASMAAAMLALDAATMPPASGTKK